MIRPGGLGGVLLALGLSGMAQASAWPQPKGQGQVIVKYEAMRAEKTLGPDGRREPMYAPRVDRGLSMLIEYGLTDRLTLQAKGEWQSGRAAFLDYEGRGPVEVGARWQVAEGQGGTLSVYAGYALAGQGRNAGYADPGQGEQDWEVRIMAGQSRERWFGDIQLARRWRQGLPDEIRTDLTLGYHLSDDWTAMGQVFAGRADAERRAGDAAWVSAELSAVRHLGPWSGQLGWRQTVAGRMTPVAQGPIVAIWRRF